MNRLRVGVIGMGLMGYAHARVYKSLPYVELVGCVEPFEKTRLAMAEKLGVPVFATTKELYALGIDAVSITTPDQLHEEAVVEALKNKVRVLVEKPLGISSESCRRMLDACPDDRYLMVGHDLHFDSRVVAAKKDLQAGKLGRIEFMTTKRTSSIPLGYKIGPRTSVCWFLGIHDLELILWLTGLKVKKVESAMALKVFSEHWDCLSALIRMENDAILSLNTHWLFPSVHSQESDSMIQIFGSDGVSEISLLKNEYSFTANQPDGRQKYTDVHYQPDDIYGIPDGMLREEISVFAQSVMKDEVPPITGKDALNAVLVIEEVENILKKTGVDIRN